MPDENEPNESNESTPEQPSSGPSPYAPNEKIVKINVAEEIKSSFLDYSMSVIISRALPDVRDGLKPSQRRILVAMNRKHTAESYFRIIDRIRAVRPDIALSSDFIVGFPGETDEDVDVLCQFITDHPFDHVVVFTYSHEPGTSAYCLQDDVPARVKTARRNKVMRLQKKLVKARQKQRLGERHAPLRRSQRRHAGGGDDRHRRDQPQAGERLMAFTSTHEIMVEWGDCDPAGIVYYPSYFKWFDQGTYRLFLKAGLRRDDITSGQWKEGTPLVAAECSFKRASQTGEKLKIESFVERFGRSSFTVRHVFRDHEGQVAAEGTETRIWARKEGDARSLKAISVPDEVRRRLTG